MPQPVSFGWDWMRRIAIPREEHRRPAWVRKDLVEIHVADGRRSTRLDVRAGDPPHVDSTESKSVHIKQARTGLHKIARCNRSNVHARKTLPPEWLTLKSLTEPEERGPLCVDFRSFDDQIPGSPVSASPHSGVQLSSWDSMAGQPTACRPTNARSINPSLRMTWSIANARAASLPGRG